MRPFYLLLVALALLLASTNAALASARTSDRSLEVISDKGISRHLRPALKTEVDDGTDEDRMMTSFKTSWTKFVTTIKNTKLAKKHETMLKSWIQNPDMTPTQAYQTLKLDKLGLRAQESPNFKVYKKYTDQLVERWVNFDAQPTTVYKALKLDQIADSSSPSFAVYGNYLKALYAQQPSGTKVTKAFVENSDMTPTYAYKLLGLDKLGSQAPNSPYFKLYKSYTDQLVTRWVNFDAQPATVYKALKLDQIADRTSPNVAVYGNYLKALYAQQPSGTKVIKAFVENSDITPTYVYKLLGLDKLGSQASNSPYFKLYQSYTDQLVMGWKYVETQPTTVYKALRLDKIPDSSSPSYAVYEKFLKVYYA
ncbi:hypothetical protein PRIC1_011650 [Phytophthora ramorum]